MAHIIFYEKPGCAGNARQRAVLEHAGHTLTRRSLLETAWTAQSLLVFLQPLPVEQWFNRAAPRIKSGELVPEALDAQAALTELLADRLLIRRPLLVREDGASLVGFDLAAVDRFVGLGTQGPADRSQSMEGCAAIDPGAGCASPGAAPRRST
jgi:nitrogenase-associated protein